MKMPAALKVLTSSSPLDNWRLASWSFAVSFLACSILLIGSAFVLHWIFLTIAALGGISLLVSFVAVRNAFVSMGANRKRLDAIWKQTALSFGAIVLVALPVYTVMMAIGIGIVKLIGLGLTETNFLILVAVVVVSCICLLASASVGWRILGKKVFNKYAYVPSLNER